MVLLILLGLIFVFFCVLTFFFTRTWRALHVVAAFLVFVAAIALMFVTALTMKTHLAWKKEFTNLENKLKQEEENRQLLAYGDPTEVRQTKDSVDSLRERLMRLTLDRGRVWRTCTPGGMANGQLDVSTVPPGVAEDQVTPPEVDMLVYAFRETVGPNDVRVPVAYLGEYRVTAVNNRTITLAASLGPDANQVAQINLPNSTWTLYEMMPVDGHRPFTNADADEPRLDDTRDQAVFGAIDEPAVTELFNQVLAENVPVAQREQFLQSGWQQVLEAYLRDGEPASETEAREDTWVKVKFLKAYEVDVDSDAVDTGLDAGYYDPSGRAVAGPLRRGEKAKFAVDDIGMLDLTQAEQLIRDGICERVVNIYHRPLNDYAFAFHSINDRLVHQLEGIRRAQRDIAALEASKKNADQQINYRSQEKAKLQQDLEKSQLEQAAVTELAQTLEQQKTELMGELSKLYQTNLLLYRQLAEIQQRLADEINQRTEAAGAAASGG